MQLGLVSPALHVLEELDELSLSEARCTRVLVICCRPRAASSTTRSKLRLFCNKGNFMARVFPQCDCQAEPMAQRRELRVQDDDDAQRGGIKPDSYRDVGGSMVVVKSKGISCFAAIQIMRVQEIRFVVVWWAKGATGR